MVIFDANKGQKSPLSDLTKSRRRKKDNGNYLACRYNTRLSCLDDAIC